MAGQLPENPSHQGRSSVIYGMHMQEQVHSLNHGWYFTKEEVENFSPSRKDGIDYQKESHLRKLYCSFLQELGMELKVPQWTIATAVMLCHRFYMRQSHARNQWQIVATASMFLAGKAEESPRCLSDLVVVAYKLLYKLDPSAPQRIRQKDIYDKQKELIVTGERLLLATVAFDLNIEHPYKALVAAIRRLEVSHEDMVRVAWNFVNDWLQTTLCLQYKPNYIAAGSMSLAAKLLKVKLPTEKGNKWWMQFDVAPKQLQEVIQQMIRLLEQNQKQAPASKPGSLTESKPVHEKATSNSPESCISSVSVSGQDSKNMALVENESFPTSITSKCYEKKTCSSMDPVEGTEHAETRDCGTVNCIVGEDDDDGRPLKPEVDDANCQTVFVREHHSKVDVHRIKESLKRRKLGKIKNKTITMDDEIDSEAWIERELEDLK